MKQRLSIYDIAQQLHISATTVSFVLNGKAGHMRISKALEEKIRRHVAIKGYKPNSLARGLRTGKVTLATSPPAESLPDPFLSFYHGSGAACI